ncbi:NADP-dependent oxidoreductase domain-containing protein [Aspergillus heterothallicus]
MPSSNHPPIPPIGLGLGSLAGVYGPPGTLEDRLALLTHAHATGLRHWDTADVYGDTEPLIGEWLRRNPEKRGEIFVATKVGLQQQADGHFAFRSDRGYVREACERSLARLGVDRIDLVYVHRVDGVTPVEETVAGLVELVEEGKISHIALSEVSPATLRRAHAIHPIAAVQMEYSLFTLDPELGSPSILETARDLGTTLVAYSPLGRGVLSGTFASHADIPAGDLRGVYPKYAEGNFAAIRELVTGIEEVAGRIGDGVSGAQVALAWVILQGRRYDDGGSGGGGGGGGGGRGGGADGFRVVAIPGTKSRARMEENAGAERVAELLSEEDIARLRRLAEKARGGIVGERYPAAVMATLCTDTPPL